MVFKFPIHLNRSITISDFGHIGHIVHRIGCEARFATNKINNHQADAMVPYRPVQTCSPFPGIALPRGGPTATAQHWRGLRKIGLLLGGMAPGRCIERAHKSPDRALSTGSTGECEDPAAQDVHKGKRWGWGNGSIRKEET